MWCVALRRGKNMCERFVLDVSVSDVLRVRIDEHACIAQIDETLQVACLDDRLYFHDDVRRLIVREAVTAISRSLSRCPCRRRFVQCRIINGRNTSGGTFCDPDLHEYDVERGAVN